LQRAANDIARFTAIVSSAVVNFLLP